MSDDEDDDDDIDDDVDEELPKQDVRVPSYWTTKTRVATLKSVNPMPLTELLEFTTETIAARVAAGADAESTSLPAFVWERLVATRGSEKMASDALSAIINGVEASWEEHAAVQLFGELNGMLSADYHGVVARRALSLLADETLVASASIASALAAEEDDADGEISTSAAVDALPKLKLPSDASLELASELKLLADEGIPLRLDKCLVQCTLAVHKHASSQPADVVEEESELQSKIAAAEAKAKEEAAAAAKPPAEEDGADAEEEDEEGDDDDFEEEDVEEEAGGPSSARELAPAAASVGGSIWISHASALSVGTDALDIGRRQQLFDQLDSDGNGQLSLSEMESKLPGLISLQASKNGGGSRGSTPRAPATMPLLNEAIGRSFDAAKTLGQSMAISPETLSRDAFDRCIAYLHATCTLLGLLELKADADEIPPLDDGDDAGGRLLPRLPPQWRVSGDVYDAAVQAERDGYAEGGGEYAVHHLALHATQMLVATEAGGGPPPGPPGGMDPIFESTEKSAFSSTYQGGEGASAPTPAGLGSSDNLASVKKGFFDASQLDVSMEDSPRGGGGNEGELRAKYERVTQEYQRTMQECEELRAKLQSAKNKEEEERELHRQNVKKMLQANEALQQQLKELNGVVDRVVTVSLGSAPTGGGGGGGGGGKEKKPPKLPSGAFPAQAKPGRRAQPPPGSKPFK